MADDKYFYNENAAWKKHFNTLKEIGMFDISKISVLNSISVYPYDFFSYTDTPNFPMYRNFYLRQNHQSCFITILVF